MKTTAYLACLLALTDFSTAAAKDQSDARAKVGDPVPDVVVLTPEGDEVKLRESAREQASVLVFYRGGWCPYCNVHLADLATIREQLGELGFQLLAVSADQPTVLRAKPENAGLDYQLLSDHSMKAAGAFGITFRVNDALFDKYRNEYDIDIEAASGETHHLLPHPAVYLIDRQGVIRFVHVNEDYRERLSGEAVLAAAKKIAAAK